MLEMYKGMVNSPETTITNDINAEDTIIYVLDETKVPEPPNLMTLGTGTSAETVKVLEVNGNALTVERGFQGVPRSWNAGTVIARNFTEYDYNALVENVKTLKENTDTNADELATHKADYVIQIDAKANKWNYHIYYPLTLQNGWTGTLEYSLNSDLCLVHIKGTIIAGTTAWNTNVATLVASIKPSSDMAVPALRNSEPYDSVSGLSIFGVFLRIRRPASDTVEEGDTLIINYVYKI